MVDPFFINFFKKLRYCEEKEIILIKKEEEKAIHGEGVYVDLGKEQLLRTD